jgi:hypothetical protein
MKKILLPLALVLCFACTSRNDFTASDYDTASAEPTTCASSTDSATADYGEPLGEYGDSKYYAADNRTTLVEVSPNGVARYPIKGDDFDCFAVTAAEFHKNRLYLVTDNGSLGGGAGYYLIYFNMDNKTFKSLGFGRSVEISDDGTYCTITEVAGVKRGECEADNEYTYRDRRVNL